MRLKKGPGQLVFVCVEEDTAPTYEKVCKNGKM